MLSPISTIVVAFISRLIDTSANEAVKRITAKAITQKRELSILFFKLFDSLYRLEDSSRAIYKEFWGYAQGTNIPMKTITRNRISSLTEDTKEFAKNLDEVIKILCIYDEELHNDLLSSLDRKMGTLRP